MPAKKLIKKTETPEAAAAPAPETPKKTVRKSAAAPKSSAATHKKAATPRVRKPAAAKASFEASMHHGEIEREAYFLWEARGYAHGDQTEDWFRAMEIVRARYE